MKTISMITIFLTGLLLSQCKKDVQKPDDNGSKINKTHFPKSDGKTIYIVLRKTSKETRSSGEIKKFIMRRISGSGMKANINIKDNYFYVTISVKAIPKSLKNAFRSKKNGVKNYFKNLLEQKIKITLQLVDSDLMATLPPGITVTGGSHFGKVIKGTYKSQVKLKSNQGLYPIMKKGQKLYMSINNRVLIHGGHILSAEVEQVKGKPWIHIKFTNSGAYYFSRFTKRYIQERLAVLVNGWVLAAPTISEHIPDGETWIAGKMTQKRALQLAAYFNASGGAGIKLISITFK